jgi:hypothetical protein
MLPEKSSPSTKLTKEKQKKQETIKAEVRDALQLGENP